MRELKQPEKGLLAMGPKLRTQKLRRACLVGVVTGLFAGGWAYLPSWLMAHGVGSRAALAWASMALMSLCHWLVLRHPYRRD